MATYIIELYRLDVTNNTFTRIAKITTYQNLRYTNVLNGIGECSFQMNIYDAQLTQANFIPRSTQIVIKRDGVIVWFGPYYNYDGALDETGGDVTIRGYTYLFHLSTRLTDQPTTYTNVDQADIARNLITLAQSRTNGNLKIVNGSEVTGVTRTRTYQYKNIAEAIVQLSNVIGGFDFEFRAGVNGAGLLSGVTFSVYYPRLGQVRTDLLPIRLGSMGNVSSFGFGIDGEIYNSGISEGAGYGDGVPLSTYDNDALQKAYTRIETYRPEKDVVEQTTLDTNLTAYMTRKQVPNNKLNFELNPKRKPQYGEFILGDTLLIDLNIQDIKPAAGDLIQYSGQARVSEIAVTIDQQGKETLIPKVILL